MTTAAANATASTSASASDTISFKVQDDSEPVALQKQTAMMLGTVRTMMEGQ